ncbi:MAG: ABC transporter ATP-binding protein [Pirellulaceae bacterium]|nr:ABC transporter ATP-binding protein [Pirellulaceae bacterium]
MIELLDVSIQAGAFSLKNVSLSIPKGEYAVLMGRTGFGKTTILEAICGLRAIVSGQILIDGIDVTQKAPADRLIGYVPQDLALFPNLDVRSHLEFALRIRKQSRALIAERVNELAKILGIVHLIDRSIDKLSGGESQRVALGRAISFRPSVLLLDEPLSALDETTRNQMQELLRQVTRASQVTTLHITHNEDEAIALADRRFHLEDGQLTRR